MSEEFNITALKTGDLHTFKEVYNTYYPVLCNYATSITKDASMAEDAVCEVFLKLWERRENTEIDSSLKSYLFKSVYHRCLNALKHIEIENRYRDFFLHHPPDCEDGGDYPLSGLIEKEINVILQKTVKELPEQCRKIFIMSRKKGMKHEAIAQELKISINTVRTQIHRALQKLRTELKDYLPFLLLIDCIKFCT